MSYQVTTGGYSPKYAADSPQCWRNECVPPERRLGSLLAEWRAEYKSLRWIGFPRAGWPHIWVEKEEGYDVSVCLCLFA